MRPRGGAIPRRGLRRAVCYGLVGVVPVVVLEPPLPPVVVVVVCPFVVEFVVDFDEFHGCHMNSAMATMTTTTIAAIIGVEFPVELLLLRSTMWGSFRDDGGVCEACLPTARKFNRRKRPAYARPPASHDAQRATTPTESARVLSRRRHEPAVSA
jgi:hypothetical protein